MPGPRAPEALLAALLVGVLASGIAAAAVDASGGGKTTPAAAVGSTQQSPAQASPVQTSPAQTSPAQVTSNSSVRSLTGTQSKPGVVSKPRQAAAKAGTARPPRTPTKRVTTTLPYTGPAPLGPTVGLAVVLLATGAWALGAPGRGRLANDSAIDRLRAPGRYRPRV